MFCAAVKSLISGVKTLLSAHSTRTSAIGGAGGVVVSVLCISKGTVLGVFGTMRLFGDIFVSWEVLIFSAGCTRCVFRCFQLGKISFRAFFLSLRGFFGIAKVMKFQQWYSFAYLKTFTCLNLEWGADFCRPRLVIGGTCSFCVAVSC